MMKPRLFPHFFLLVSVIWLQSFSVLAAPYTAVMTTPTATAMQTLPAFSKIAAGQSYTCALTSGGGVWCWGADEAGQLGDGTTVDRSTPVAVTGLDSGVTALTTGSAHTCALTSEGGVLCWGSNFAGALGDGTTTSRSTPVAVSGLGSGVTALAAGQHHTCALTNGGGVLCWGYNQDGQLGDGAPPTSQSTPVAVIGLEGGVTALAAGYMHTCALMSGGEVLCWGRNQYGQLGDGTTTDRSTPVAVIGLGGGVAALAAGESHTCALMIGGGAKCWGYNGYGQLGDGTFTDHSTPVALTWLGSGVAALTAGRRHTCALTSEGEALCWGSNWQGQLGGGVPLWRTTPVTVSGLESGVTALAAGDLHTCALTSGGGTLCWGSNKSGQLGNGVTTWRSIPVAVTGLGSGVTALAAGWAHTCVLTSAGGVLCWGYNQSGQLGDGTTTNRSTPAPVSGLESGVTALAAGLHHTCALTSGGSMVCWGDNRHGQLGDGTTTDRSAPVAVTGLESGVMALTTGDSHTCALTSAGGAKCWGNNLHGRLGDGTYIERHTPVAVSGLESGVAALAAGGAHTCALTSAGGVLCWGSNWYGELGDGTNTSSQSTPVAVTGLSSGVTSLAAGGSHTCALTNEGGMVCWGDNRHGQLGDGTTTNRSTPVAVTGLGSGMMALAMNGSHTCALTSEGGMLCWGYNRYGQLGDGTTADRSIPVTVTGLGSGGMALTAGNFFTCVSITGGQPKCWGWDGYGQLGLGTILQHMTPVAVVASLPARIGLNYTFGQPGSFFTLTGENFPPSSAMTVAVNGQVLTDVLQTNETGGFIFFLATPAAEEGFYAVTVSVNPSATARFFLQGGAPLRVQEGGGTTVAVPAGLGLPIHTLCLPLVIRTNLP